MSLPAPIAFLLVVMLPMVLVGVAICIIWDTFFFSRNTKLWRLRDDLADAIRDDAFTDDTPAKDLLAYIETARERVGKKGPFSITLMRLITVFGDPYQHHRSRPDDFLRHYVADSSDQKELTVFVRRFENIWVRSSIWRLLPADWVLNSIDWFSASTGKTGKSGSAVLQNN